MAETNYEMISRFKKHIRDSNENVFFIFPDDEKEAKRTPEKTFQTFLFFSVLL